MLFRVNSTKVRLNCIINLKNNCTKYIILNGEWIIKIQEISNLAGSEGGGGVSVFILIATNFISYFYIYK